MIKKPSKLNGLKTTMDRMGLDYNNIIDRATVMRMAKKNGIKLTY